MAPCTGLVVVKKFPYRGATDEEWSNKYHFRGPPPVTSAEWASLASGFAALEKTLYSSRTKIVRYYGYDSDDPKAPAVWSEDLELTGSEIPGTFVGTDVAMAGDQCGLIEWALDAKSIKGKQIRLYKFIHDGQVQTGQPDLMSTAWNSVAGTFALAVSGPTGGYWGGLRSLAHDAPTLSAGPSLYVTTHTLHRRGKKKVTAPAIGFA